MTAAPEVQLNAEEIKTIADTSYDNHQAILPEHVERPVPAFPVEVSDVVVSETRLDKSPVGLGLPATAESSTSANETSTHTSQSSSANIPSRIVFSSCLERLEKSINDQGKEMNDQAKEMTDSIKHDLYQKSRELSIQVAYCQHQQQTNLRLEKDLLVVQDTIKELQEESLALISGIQVMAERILVQTFELHDLTVPRLFIVLPKPIGKWDKLGTKFWHEFRLFFLCEGCGMDVKDGESDTKEIHLAIHRGYDLKRPTEFFEKYASYVLTLLKTIKYGIKSGGVTVTPLAQLLERLDEVRIGLDLANNTAGFLAEKAITIIEGTMKQGDLNMPESLKGADLRQLESFLVNTDKTMSYGNLCRIITEKGHVKWVCRKYYQQHSGNAGKSSMKKLAEEVAKCGGILDEHLCRVQVKITSQKDANQFYKALGNTKGLAELSICLDWDASQADLQALVSAISMTDITHLAINGSKIKQRMYGYVHFGHRFHPIIKLLSRQSIRSLTLDGFTDFYQRVIGSHIVPFIQLRVLSVDSRVHNTSPGSVFSKFMQSCPSLVKLTIKCDKLRDVFDYFEDNVHRFKKLETLILESRNLSVAVKVDDSQISSITGTLRGFQELSRPDSFLYSSSFTKLTYSGCFIKLTVNWDTSADVVVLPLERFLEQGLGLAELDISVPLSWFNHLLERIISISRSSTLPRIVLNNEGTAQGMDLVTVIVSPDNPSIDITTDIQMKSNQHDEHLLTIFKQYGHTIRTLTTNEQFLDNHLFSMAIAIISRKSNLTSFVLNTTSLGDHRDAIHDVITESAKLESIHLEFNELQRKDQRDLARQLLGIYGPRITGLSLGGQPVQTWGSGQKELSDMQKLLVKLETFRLICNTRQELSYDHAKLIAAIVSPPRSTGDVSPSPNSPISNSSSISMSSTATPSTLYPSSPLPSPLSALSKHPSSGRLRELCLEYVVFEKDSWELIINALDLTVLKSLSFEGSNFDRLQLELLLNRIPDENIIPFKTLELKNTDLEHSEEGCEVERRNLVAMLQERWKVPRTQ